MFLTYTAGVILVSLAIYGMCQIIKDIWNWFVNLGIASLPETTLVIIVKDMEHDIEYLMRFLCREVTFSGKNREEDGMDIVVADLGSADLTFSILTRLADETNVFKLVNASRMVKPVSDVLPFCRGAVVHLLDLTGRMKKDEFEAAVRLLLSLKS